MQEKATLKKELPRGRGALGVKNKTSVRAEEVIEKRILDSLI